MNEYNLKLQPPAFLNVSSACGTYNARLDVFETWRAMAAFAKEPTEDQQWTKAKAWVAAKLKDQEGKTCPTDQISESVARAIQDAAITAGRLEDQLLKNELGRMLSSGTSTTQETENLANGPTS